ncbi:hypothetical protein V2O64_06450 [Verrucomicrobiaceae bacterium 227]
MKQLKRILFFLMLGSAVFLGWHFRDPIASLYQKITREPEVADLRGTPNPELYQELIQDLKAKRLVLAERYSKARTAPEISQVIKDARATLHQDLPAMMRCWLGTEWDFNGTSSKPGEGKVACGYFISTILRDAGFKVERIKLAQQASQNIIATFLSRKEMHVARHGQPYDEFLAKVISRGPGIRIVGLDRHVAFILVNDDQSIRFIHSSGGHPYCVVDEDRDNATALQNSKYRVTGDFTHSDDVIHRWLVGEKWPTKL